MNTRLLKRLAAEDIDNITLDKLCELLKISLDDINSNISDVVANFFNEDNKSFVSALNSIYRICLIYYKGNIDEAQKQCIDTCTLKYLFQYQRINIDTQLQFFNELIASFDNKYEIKDPNSSLVNQLRSYIILGDDIAIDSVEEIINNIDISPDSIEAIQEACNDANGQVKAVIDGPIESVLNNRNLPLDTLFALLSQNLNLDQTVVEELNFGEEQEEEIPEADNKSDIEPDIGSETNQESTPENEANPEPVQSPASNTSLPSSTEEEISTDETPVEQEIPDVATELFQNNEEVHVINNKYRIDHIQFSYLLSAYTENQLNDALEKLLPELFPDDMFNSISQAIFKSIFRKTNSELTQAQLQKQFDKFKKKGHKVLNLFIKNKNANTILPISTIKLYLQLLDPELAKKITFTKDSTFATTFTHYVLSSSHANLYAAPMETRINNFITNNDLVTLYNEANNIEPKESPSDNVAEEPIKNTPIQNTSTDNKSVKNTLVQDNQPVDNQFNNSSAEQTVPSEEPNQSEQSNSSNLSNQSSQLDQSEENIPEQNKQDDSKKNKRSNQKTKKKVEDISDKDITYLFDIINNPQKVNQAIINYVTSLFTSDNIEKYIYAMITNAIEKMVTNNIIIRPQNIEKHIQVTDEKALKIYFKEILPYTSSPDKLSPKQFKQLLIDIDPILIKRFKYKTDSVLVKSCFTYIIEHIDICVDAIAKIWSKYFTHETFEIIYNTVCSEHSEELEALNQYYIQNNTPKKDDTPTKQDEQVVEQLVRSTRPKESTQPTPVQTDSMGNITFDSNTVKEFIKTIASHYSMTPNQVALEIINRAMLTIDNLDIINAKNVRTPFNVLLNFQNNTTLGNAVLEAITKYFSSKDFIITKPAINSTFAKSLFEFIRVNKAYANFIRNRVNALFRSTSKPVQNTQQNNSSQSNTSQNQSNESNRSSETNRVNQSSEISRANEQQKTTPAISNRDLSWQEIRQLPTVDKANEVNDSVKDDVNFNIANFFNNEKLIVLRDDVLTAPSGMSYQNMINDYSKENPDIPIDAYATGILSNNCAFITSYGKLDKLEVIKTIKQYCSVSKIYFKQGNRNLMLIMERIARRKR